MIFKTVTYSKLFNLGLYSNERIGIDGELEEGETVQGALAKAKKEVEEFHDTYYPEDMRGTTVKIIEPVNSGNVEDKYVLAIETVTDPDVLKTFSKLATDKYPKFKEAYDKKLQSLEKK